MKVFTVAAQKGGVGKTTFCRHWSVIACSQGLKSAIIDLDTQGTSANWYRRRKRNEISENGPVVLGANRRNLKEALKACENENIDVVFIDTRPEVTPTVDVAIENSDYVIFPCSPSQDDIDGLSPTVDKVLEHDRPSFIVINKGRHGDRVNEAVIKTLKGYGVEICPTIIKNRTIIPDAIRGGRSILETRLKTNSDRAALEEFEGAWNWITKTAKIQRRKRRRAN